MSGQKKKYRIAGTFGFDNLDREEKLRRVILIRVILLTVFFGLIWSILYFILGLQMGGTVVLSYAFLSLANLTAFYLTQKYNPFRMAQLILILLLPVATQLSLGGFYSASGVVLASILCPLGALMFYDMRTARIMFILFLGVVAVAAAVELIFPDRSAAIDKNIVILFYGMNTMVISSIVFALLVYFVAQRALFQKLLAEKNKDLTDSIKYAKRIQEAILPSVKFMKTTFPDSFILYKPKDIVAGDFYFFEMRDDLAIFAAADCTGHGVPGAMVSVVCSNALQRVIKEFKITDPGIILDKVRDIVIDTFIHSEKQEGKTNEYLKDGMDISLVVMNLKTRELKWAGANNPLWIFRTNKENEIAEVVNIIECKPDKQPIGSHSAMTSFNTHTVQLMEGDCIYMFTDGYADQFGGEKGKKFKVSNIKKMLESLYHKPMDQQSLRIGEIFENWQGDLEQVDDVCMIGVRI